MLAERRADMQAREARNIPARWKVGPGGSPLMYITITGGNTLSDGSTLGIKLKTGLGGVATVPSVYDPNVTTTFVDGIGRGVLTIAGVVQSGYVLVVNDQESMSAIQTALAATWRVTVLPTTRFIPLSGDPTQGVNAYQPYFK